MGPESKKKYINLVAEKIASRETSLINLEHARNTSDSKMTSRYDTQREHFAEEADQQRTILGKLKEFQKLLEQWETCTRIIEGAEFTVRIEDAGSITEGAIYSSVKITLPDVLIITPQSPIGAAIKDMVAGDNFTYKVNGKSVIGQIKEIK